MNWASLGYFFLLIILFAVVVWYFLQKKKKIPALQFSGLSDFKKVDRSLRVRFIYIPHILKVLALVFVVIALARPRKSDVKIKKNVEGVDIVIALDISDSMLIEDMKPKNRLESSKKIIKEFVEGRVSDRVGLVVFSGESYTRVPLTLDYEIYQKSLREVETTRNVKMGTAIGVALANAVGRLRDSAAKSRVIILLTDGENNSGTIDPETALSIAKGYQIKVYTIGVGEDGQKQLPITSIDAFGRKRTRYQPIHSKINEKLLRKIAEETGGKFWRAQKSDSLKGVFNEINKLERTKIDIEKFTKYSELFPKFLWISVLLYLLSILLELTFFRRGP